VSERKANGEQPGLALRMQRERRVISAQHRQLDDFYHRVASAVHGDLPDAARAAFARFADALEAHLALEDGLYFPALRGLRPALGVDLEALCDEHQRLREALARLARLIEAGPCAPCAAPLERLAGDIAEHEGREEGLLASIQSERRSS
jgi:iron-sulfur cluster repair protein YtfE (RIC family)